MSCAVLYIYRQHRAGRFMETSVMNTMERLSTEFKQSNAYLSGLKEVVICWMEQSMVRFIQNDI